VQSIAQETEIESFYNVKLVEPGLKKNRDRARADSEVLRVLPVCSVSAQVCSPSAQVKAAAAHVQRLKRNQRKKEVV